MKLITASGAKFGPFIKVDIVDDAYHADGVVYQFSVLGEDHSCIDTPDDYELPKPMEPVPEFVTARQARQFLAMNDMLVMVNTLVNNIPGKDGDIIRVVWEFSTEIRRDSPLVNRMYRSLGWDSSQLDDFFRAAKKL